MKSFEAVAPGSVRRGLAEVSEVVSVGIAMNVRRLVGFAQIVAETHDGQGFLMAGVAEGGAHERQAEMALPFLELFQGNAAPRDGEEVEIETFRVSKEVFRLHLGIERIDEALRGRREFLGNLTRLDRARRHIDRVKSAGQRKERGNGDQRNERSKIAPELHGDPLQRNCDAGPRLLYARRPGNLAPHTVKPIVLMEKNMVKPHFAQMSVRNSLVGPRPAKAPMGLDFGVPTKISMTSRLVPLQAAHFSEGQRSLSHLSMTCTVPVESGMMRSFQ